MKKYPISHPFSFLEKEGRAIQISRVLPHKGKSIFKNRKGTHNVCFQFCFVLCDVILPVLGFHLRTAVTDVWSGSILSLSFLLNLFSIEKKREIKMAARIILNTVGKKIAQLSDYLLYGNIGLDPDPD